MKDISQSKECSEWLIVPLMRLSRQHSTELTTSKGLEDPEATSNPSVRGRPILRSQAASATPSQRSKSLHCKKVSFLDLEEGKQLCQVFEYEKDQPGDMEPVVRKSHCCEAF